MEISYDTIDGKHVVLASYTEGQRHYMLAIDITSDPHTLCLISHDVCALQIAEEASGGVIVDRTFTVNAGNSNAVIQLVNASGNPLVQLTTNRGLNFENVEAKHKSANATNNLISARMVDGSTVRYDGYFLKAMPASGAGGANVTSDYPGAQMIFESGGNTFIGSGRGGTNLYDQVKKMPQSNDNPMGNKKDLFLSGQGATYIVNNASVYADSGGWGTGSFAFRFNKGYLDLITSQYAPGSSQGTQKESSAGIRFYARNGSNPIVPGSLHSYINPGRIAVGHWKSEEEGWVSDGYVDGLEIGVSSTKSGINGNSLTVGTAFDGSPKFGFGDTGHPSITGEMAFRSAINSPKSDKPNRLSLVATYFKDAQGKIDLNNPAGARINADKSDSNSPYGTDDNTVSFFQFSRDTISIGHGRTADHTISFPLPRNIGGTGATGISSAASGVASAYGGHTISSQYALHWGRLCCFTIAIKLGSAIGDSISRITQIATINSAYRPVYSVPCETNASTISSAYVSLNQGEVMIKTPANVTVAANTTISVFSGVYIRKES